MKRQTVLLISACLGVTCACGLWLYRTDERPLVETRARDLGFTGVADLDAYHKIRGAPRSFKRHFSDEDLRIAADVMTRATATGLDTLIVMLQNETDPSTRQKVVDMVLPYKNDVNKRVAVQFLLKRYAESPKHDEVSRLLTSQDADVRALAQEALRKGDS